MMRTPPRLPLPRRPHLTLRMPPLAGIRSPASGLRAMKSTNSNRSSSVQSAPAWRMNTAVSATVIGRVRICAMYANGAYFQDGHRGRRPLLHDACAPCRRGDRLGTVRDGADHPWRERSLRRRAHPRCRVASEPRRPVRAALWADRAADFVYDPGIALHETYGLTSHRRALSHGAESIGKIGRGKPAS